MFKSGLAMAMVTALVTLSTSTMAQEFQADEGQLDSLYPEGKPYSPYVNRNFPERPLWGDSHLHTALSMDAGGFGNRLGLEEAYRFARGEQVNGSSGQPVRLARPLDWLAITDHSDGMGLIDDMLAALPLVTMANYSPGSRRYATVWDDVINAAEEFNDPGVFTAFIGFEWTSLAAGANLHRNVIFRDGPDRARQVVPYTTQPPMGSIDPLDLYKYLETYESKTNGATMTFAHNGNLSNGIMFPMDAQYTGRKIDKFYVEQRAKWERMYEVTQIKGDGEAHPFLSPDDEFADYGTWDVGNLDLSTAKTDAMLAGEYAREALKNGMLLEQKLGTNPYKFGMIGSTDSHTSLATTEENNFFGKHAGYEPSAERLSHPFMKNENGELFSWQQVASGLAAVWARENTRASLFDAMDRKEVYGTTGPRIVVRFFGGYNFAESDLKVREIAATGYDKGVPMGSDLTAAPEGKSPTFLVAALRDPIGANLDRIQIVKGWVDSKGKTHEKVYDVAWSGKRNFDSKGKLPAVGNTVDVTTATWANTIGSAELLTVWQDPKFDPAQRAFYYARVLEIPTPPWYLYDVVKYGLEMPEGAPRAQQERAYTSPIWYTPRES